MDDSVRHRATSQRSDADLASIVLGATSEARAAQAPEPAPLPGAGRVASTYDARSVLVLAVVVAVLAGLVGWAMTVSRSVPSAAPAAATATQPDRSALVGAPQAPALVTAAPALAPAAVAGVELAPGRITATKTGGGGGAIVRVAVANRGSEALEVGTGARVVVLVDGEVAGSEQLGAIDSDSAGVVEIFLSACPAGAHQVTALVDPASVVREGNERNNARSSLVTFGC